MEKMNFEIPKDYLLANSPYVLKGIGTMVSPTLKNIFDGSTDNLQTYYFAKALVGEHSDNIIKMLSTLSDGVPLTQGASVFEELIKTETRQNLFAKVLSLFFINRVAFENSAKAFVLLPIDEDKNELEGCITGETFDLYISLIGQLLHEAKPTLNEKEDLSGKPPEVLKALAAFEKYEKKEKGDNYKDYILQNIISKMCAVGSGYTLLNIYDLTVWQLFDQFQAYAQNRISRLTERSFSIWGGENFDFGLWLKNNT